MQGSRRFALRALSLLSFLSLDAAALRAQGAPVAPISLAQLQRIGSLPVEEQRRNPNQAFLRLWFARNVEVYRRAAEASVLGRSPALFNPGPPAYPTMQGAWTQIWGPTPGYHDILWDNRANPGVAGYPAPLNWIWPEEIGFGLQGGQVSEYGGLINTCWHEALHAILGQWALDEIEPSAYADLRSGTNQQEIKEHIYINWAERSVEWIGELAEFERLVRVAAAEQERYRSNGVPINWAIEHYIWRDAWVRWSVLRESNFGKTGSAASKIANLTPALRDQFLLYTGIRVPLLDEVVRFYMAGGVTTDANTLRNSGTRIPVPEWVLIPDYRRGRVIQLATTPAAPTCRVTTGAPTAGSQSVSCAFGVNLIDTYATANTRSVRAGVARGSLRVSFFTPGDAQTNARELADPDARVTVRLGNVELPASIAKRVFGAVDIDLPALYRTSAAVPFSSRLPGVSKPISLDVEFSRGRVESLKADKRFGLSLKYKDADDAARGPAVYGDAEAIFFVTVRASGGAASSVSDGRATSQGSASTTPARTTSTAAGRGWYLVKTLRLPEPPVVVDVHGNTGGVAQERGKLPWYWDYTRTEESPTSFAYRMHYSVRPTPTVTDAPHVEAIRARRFTWSAPPSFVAHNTGVKLEVTLDAAGSAATSDRETATSSVIPSQIKDVLNDGIMGRLEYVKLPEDRSKVDSVLVAFGSGSFTGHQRALGTHPLILPSPGDYLSILKYDLVNAMVLLIEAESHWDRYAMVYLYEFRNGPAASPATAEFLRQDAPEAPADPDIDNVPPSPPPATPPAAAPRKRASAGSWYTHPSGDWRIWLPGGSRLRRGETAADFDEINGPIRSVRLRIWRGADAVSDGVGRVVSAPQAVADRKASLLADTPTATATDLPLGSAPAVVIERREATGEKRWEYWFAADGRLYRADFVRSAEATAALPVHPGTSMLGTLEFLRTRKPDASGVRAAPTPSAPPASETSAAPSSAQLSVDPTPAIPPAPSLDGRGEILVGGPQSMVSLTNSSRIVWTRCLLTLPGKRSYRLGSVPSKTGRDYPLTLFKSDANALELQGEAVLQCVEGTLRFPVENGLP